MSNSKPKGLIRFEISKASKIHTVVFLGVTLYSFVCEQQRFRSTSFFHLHNTMFVGNVSTHLKRLTQKFVI